jgi:zinc/manganese transport system permease protein
VHQLFTWVVEPGFFSSAPARTAALVGGVVAVVSAVVGVFTVMRGQSFGGHALGDVAAAGGSGAVLIGLSPLAGFVGLSAVGAGVMDLIGVRRVRGRDLATGIVLGAAIGLSALFLYLDTTGTATTGATQQVLFGSIFTTTSGTVPVVVIFSVLALGAIAAIWRPLLLATVSPDIAAARGVPVRLVGLAYMLALAVAVGLSSLTIGAILSTALLIGPPAAALRLTRRTGRAPGLRDRGGRHLARCPAGLRQLLLGRRAPGLAGQLLHRRRHLRRLPAHRPAPPANGGPAGTNGRGDRWRRHPGPGGGMTPSRKTSDSKEGSCSRVS